VSVRLGADPQSAALWLAADVRKHLNRLGTTIGTGPLTPARFAQLLALLASRRIHGRIAKAVLDAVFAEDKDPEAIIAEKGWEQITDRREVGRHIDAVLAANAGVVETIRGGDARPVSFLVGEIMRATSGRADPGLVQELVRARLAVTMVQVLSLGGAITGRVTEAGDVAAGDAAELMRLLEA
jgi:aspartyl-tRNA(Asn)/glutamyl-tRNA(Gln) amidotransferase subunit B